MVGEGKLCEMVFYLTGAVCLASIIFPLSDNYYSRFSLASNVSS